MIEGTRLDTRRANFGQQLTEALDMADREQQVSEVAASAMAEVSVAHPMELLIADPGRAQMEHAATHPAAGAPGCGVSSPYDCVAVRRGTVVTFSHSEDLNACVQLGAGKPYTVVMCDLDRSSFSTTRTVMRPATPPCKLGKTPAFTASFGIADSSMSGQAGDLIQLADVALYQAKATGRDRACIADATLRPDTPAVRRTEQTGAGIEIAEVAELAEQVG